MKLSLHISTSEESSNSAADSDNNPDKQKHPDINNITCILEDELISLCPYAGNFENAEISITFMKPDEIRELNRTYRNIDEATDVLSFPMIDDEPVEIPELPELALGDIVICPEEVSRLHPELGQEEAICLMIAHSFLHLLGYDHDTEEKQAEMWELQDRIAARMTGRSKA